MAQLRGATWARGNVHGLLPRPGGLAHGVVLLAGGSAAGQAIVLLATPLLARLYTPAEFGAWNVFSSIASVLVVVACLRFEVAIPLPPDERTAFRLLVLASAAPIGMAALVLAGVAGIQLLGPGRWSLTSSGVLWLLPLAVVAGGIYQAVTYWSTRRGAFGVAAQTKLIQGTASVAQQAGFGLLHPGALALVAGDVLSRGLGTFSLARLAAETARRELPAMNLRVLRETARAYRRFSLLGTVSAVINATALSLAPPLFAALYGEDTAGHLGLGTRLIVAPATLLTMAVSQVLFARLASLANEAPADFHGFFRATAWRLGASAAVLGVGGVVCAPLAMGWLFTAKWDPAIPMAQLLGLQAAAGVLVSPLSQVVFVAHRQGAQLAADLLRLALVLGAILGCAAAWPNEPVHAVAGYTVAMLVAYGAMLLVYDRIAAGVSRRA